MKKFFKSCEKFFGIDQTMAAIYALMNVNGINF